MNRARIFVVVATMVLVAVACDWSQVGFGPSHRSFNDTETSFTTANVSGITPSWFTSSVTTGESLISWGNHVALTAAASGGREVVVFAADGSSCTPTCTPQWRTAPGSYSGIAVTGTTLFATLTTDAVHARLAAFDANGVQGCSGAPATCTPLWTATWNATSVRAPVIADGRVYVAGGGSTQVIDAAGTTGCSTVTHTCTPLFSLLGADGTPSIDGGLAFSATASEVLVFDATGSTCSGPCLPLRHLATGASPRTPAVGNGFVYVLNATALVVFDAKPAAACPGTPATCSPRWTAPATGPGTGGPVVTATTVFVTTGGALRAFDALGTTGCAGTPKVCSALWQGSVPGYTFRNHPIATASILFVDALEVGGSRAKVVAIDVQGVVGCSGAPKTCAPLWSSSPVGEAYPAEIIAANSRVFWAHRDFGLNAVELPA